MLSCSSLGGDLEQASAPGDDGPEGSESPARARFEALRRHFDACVDLDASARADHVRAVAREDAELAAELQAMLAEDEGEAHDPIAAAFSVEDGVAAAPVRLAAGNRIGPYVIERELGHGGMGSVFVASRKDPIRRVALKVLTQAPENSAWARRFEFEGEILARLSHPNIAHVYEIGTAVVGGRALSWYSMELVEGAASLATLAEARPIDTMARLQVFLELCSAVQYAHQRGVIHRDLKPGNVLLDETGHVKLIDFGIAKQTDTLESPSIELTMAGQVIGTLAYMSPEQARGASEDVDARTDVYALGVLAYLLLTGELPLDFSGKSLPECLVAIERAPVRQEPLDAASVPTDAQVILRKALAKDIGHRYASVDALAADIGRFMRSEPISARPPSMLYQLRKFTSRNRLFVGAAATVSAAVVAGAIVSTVGFMRAREAQREAEQQRDRAEASLVRAEKAERSASQAADFAVDLLFASDPYAEGSGAITTEEAAERAAERLDERGDLDPQVEFRLRMTLAGLFSNLERSDATIEQLTRALELDPSEEERLEIERQLILARLDAHEGGDQTEIAKALRDRFVERYGPDDPKTLSAEKTHIRAVAKTGNLDYATAELSALMERERELFGDDSDEVIESGFSLAEWQFNHGNLAEAEAEFGRLVETSSAKNGGEHPTTLGLRLRLTEVRLAQGDAAAALTRLEALLPLVEQRLGERHEMTFGVLNTMGTAHSRIERGSPRASAVYRTLLERMPAEHPARIAVRSNLAIVLLDADELQEAEALLVELWQERLADDAPGAGLGMCSTALAYAKLLERTGRPERALEILNLAYERGRADFGPKNWFVEIVAFRRAEIAGEDPPMPTTERGRNIVNEMIANKKKETARAVEGPSAVGG